MMMNKVRNEILLEPWGEATCTQDAPNNVHQKYSNNIKICPISFIQKCDLFLYI
jgi:hypothetical protein